METLAEYLDRKHGEVTLLNSFLNSPLSLQRPNTVSDVVTHKFKLAAAMKAEHTLGDWAITETAWAHPGRVRSGPFKFSYDYQRADLEVRGPPFYTFAGWDARRDTIYTASGMAAIAALVFALTQLFTEADILTLPGTYSEALELLEAYARPFHLLRIKQLDASLPLARVRRRVLLFDSCLSSADYDAALACQNPGLDLVFFDTTCFAANSGRIRRVLNWAHGCKIPVVMVRSHTKLDSLGIEYGRLGSAAFVSRGAANNELLSSIADEMRKAVRLLGGAALPQHFPPYVGADSYRRLTSRRIGAIIRNTRNTARYFAHTLPRASGELHFSHGLYLVLISGRIADEEQARQIAAGMATHLEQRGLPFRHAGSFGFDFGAAEWVHHLPSDRYAIRIAVADLPGALWQEVAEAVSAWWKKEGL
jgi:hypothetical protein